MPGVCPHCAKNVYFAEEIKCLGKSWHKLCLKCFSCNKTVVPGGVLEHNKQIYCKTCHYREFGPKGYGFGNVLRTEHVASRVDCSDSRSLGGDPEKTDLANLIMSRTPCKALQTCDVRSTKSSSTSIATSYVTQSLPRYSRGCLINAQDGESCLTTTATLPRKMKIGDTPQQLKLKSPFERCPKLPEAQPPLLPKPFLPPKAVEEPKRTPWKRTHVAPKCFKCSSSVYHAELAKAGSNVYHLKCFKCETCRKHLDSNYCERGSLLYCNNCYKRSCSTKSIALGVRSS